VSNPRYWAVVPAAGVGSRVGAAVPKQYLPLRGRAVIDHALDPFLDHPAVAGVVLALSAGDGWWQATAHAGHPRIRRVEGGPERCHSVLNALDHLAAVAAPEDWVLVHDAARPCLRREDLERLMAIDPGECGGLLARPIHDTVKRSGADGRVAATLPREDLWRAFTPQMFRLEPLRGALRAALDRGERVTDDASAMELAGFSPVLVEGQGDNLKITRPEDLELAAYHLEVQGR
jgi:2-C-methyl-D-erythritol 4-phosphate cytidylyltransferase